MPTYEYECGSCGHRMEEMQRMTDPALVDCPECKMPDLNRVPQPGLDIGCFKSELALESYGAPCPAVRKQQERDFGFRFDSKDRLLVGSPSELKRVKKIFGDAP